MRRLRHFSLFLAFAVGDLAFGAALETDEKKSNDIDRYVQDNPVTVRKGKSDRPNMHYREFLNFLHSDVKETISAFEHAGGKLIPPFDANKVGVFNAKGDPIEFNLLDAKGESVVPETVNASFGDVENVVVIPFAVTPNDGDYVYAHHHLEEYAPFAFKQNFLTTPGGVIESTPLNAMLNEWFEECGAQDMPKEMFIVEAEKVGKSLFVTVLVEQSSLKNLDSYEPEPVDQYVPFTISKDVLKGTAENEVPIQYDGKDVSVVIPRRRISPIELEWAAWVEVYVNQEGRIVPEAQDLGAKEWRFEMFGFVNDKKQNEKVETVSRRMLISSIKKAKGKQYQWQLIRK